MITLEQEFENRKAQHKFNILKIMLMDYYVTKEQTEPDIPEFMKDEYDKKRIELLAVGAIKDLACQCDSVKFNSLYERAWQKLAPVFD